MWARPVLRQALRPVGELGKNLRITIPGSRFGVCGFSTKGTIQDRVYTSEQRDVVIERLNSIKTDENVRKLLGTKLTTNIETHLLKNGNFTKLEELLKVQAIGPKTIRNVCDKLLGICENDGSKSVGSGRRSRSLVNTVSPQLPEEIRARVKVLVSVIVDLTSISWAHVDTKKKYLLGWQTIKIDDTVTSLKDVVVTAAEVEKLFPEADLYVLEDPTAGGMNSRSGHQMKSHFTCALAASVHNQKEQDGVFRLVFVRNRLVEKHFKATVGSETVSLQPFMYDVIAQKVALGRSTIFVSQEQVGYMKSLEPVFREQLCRAGLLAVSCIDLVLMKNDVLETVDENA